MAAHAAGGGIGAGAGTHVDAVGRRTDSTEDARNTARALSVAYNAQARGRAVFERGEEGDRARGGSAAMGDLVQVVETLRNDPGLFGGAARTMAAIVAGAGVDLRPVQPPPNIQPGDAGTAAGGHPARQ